MCACVRDVEKESDLLSFQFEALQSCSITSRNQFKFAMPASKVLYETAPSYLDPLVRVSDVPGRRCLRSACTDRLVVPPFKLSSFGSRTLKVAAAQTSCNKDRASADMNLRHR